MAKKITLLTVFGLLFWQSSIACDACGCSISGNGIGMLTAFRNNFIGIGWQRSTFHGTPGHGDETKDYFHTIELSARYHFSDKFKILVNQPYRINMRKTEEDSQSISGISDTRIVASYSILQNKKIGKQTTLFFEIGGGIKLPVGKYNSSLHETDLPDNFNIGNGSWGYIVQPNVVLNRRKTGILLAGLYQHFSKSSSGYRFGHQLSTRLLAFQELTLSEKIKLIPNAGISAEWVTEDQFSNGKNVTGTGGRGAFATAGLNLKTENCLIGFSYSHPMAQSYSDGEVKAQERLSCQFSYVF